MRHKHENLGNDLMDAAFAIHNVLHKAEQALRHLDYDDKQNQKFIGDLKNLVDAQGQPGTWDLSPYHCGIYNGLELALSIFERREPRFKDIPDAVGGRQFPPKSDKYDFCYNCDEVVNPSKHDCSKVSTSSDDVLGAKEYIEERGKIFKAKSAEQLSVDKFYLENDLEKAQDALNEALIKEHFYKKNKK